ncbi:hypothetical protein DMC64_41960 [Amycolatopsis sp. WAC 04197]|uniref:hypothetical protein n=1 Tax=Amycolatopsis sp. WAC 04197 TaxID=2203199 RepID=UPI000F7A6C66|nr:hypothetical protein [Amycolatopsis sp. WAC 04197]RSN38635.1 hypothetical protein DMC64_41960 [Amycolatopsis sp. WAC 04197]
MLTERALTLTVSLYRSWTQNLGHAAAEAAAKAAFRPELQKQVFDEYARQSAFTVIPFMPPVVQVDYDLGNLTCPYPSCSTLNAIKEIDDCTRENDVRVAEGRVLIVGESPEFQHVAFYCDACTQLVSMPLGIDLETRDK